MREIRTSGSMSGVEETGWRWDSVSRSAKATPAQQAPTHRTGTAPLADSTKNLTEDGKRSPPARLRSYGFAAERLLGGNSSYPCALLAYRAAPDGWAITARMLLDGRAGPRAGHVSPTYRPVSQAECFVNLLRFSEHSSQAIGQSEVVHASHGSGRGNDDRCRLEVNGFLSEAWKPPAMEIAGDVPLAGPKAHRGGR